MQKTDILCKDCQKPLVLINSHWVDPLVQCGNKNCPNKAYSTRMSKIGDKHREED